MNPIHSGIPEFTGEVSPQAEEKALRDHNSAFAPFAFTEKPVLRAKMGLQSSCQKRKSQKSTRPFMNLNPNVKSQLIMMNQV
jgi:hypothetical protein